MRCAVQNMNEPLSIIIGWVSCWALGKQIKTGIVLVISILKVRYV